MGDDDRPPCPVCSGNGGRTVDDSHDGITLQRWEPCSSCQGTGKAW